MTFTDILKNCPTESTWALTIGVDTHFFLTTETGAIIYLNPKTGASKIVYNISTSNIATIFTYSHTKNAVYFFSGESEPILIQFELDTFEVKVFEFTKYLDVYTNYFINTNAGEIRVPHFVLPSTDGNVWFSNYRYRGIPGICKFDTTTETFSVPGYLSDKEFDHLHGRQYVAAIKVNNTAFSGVYVNYLFDSSYNDIYDEVIAELVSSGLSYTLSQNFIIYVHWSDRAAGSSTRRVIVRAPNWRVIDLKSPSTYLDRQTAAGTIGITGSWVDQAATPVDSSGWTTGTLATYAAELGVTLPSYDPVIAYSRVRFVGRFPYQWGNYMANKSIFFNFAYDPDTGAALYPDTFNKLTTFLNNGESPLVYLATMPMAQGFSADPEYVAFIQNQAGVRGYYRPDTKAWTAYDPVTDPNGYIIAAVDLNNPNDPNGIGVYCQPNTDGNPFGYLGELWQYSPYGTAAINPEIVTIVDEVRDLCTIQLEYTPNILTDIIKTETFDGIGTSVGTISCGVETASGEFVFGGTIYSGIVVGKDNLGSFEQTRYFGDVLSIYTCEVFGNYVIFSGYLGRMQAVDMSDVDAPTITDIVWGINQYNTSLAARADAVIATGNGTRLPAYQSSYMKFGYINSFLAQNYFVNLPKILDVYQTIYLRSDAGLENESYDNATTFAKLKAFQSAGSYTWTQVKDLFTSTTPYHMDGVVAYGNEAVFLLRHAGISALRNIEIPVNEDGTGGTITSDFGRSTHYPKVLYFNKADLGTLVEADYKLVEIQAIGYADAFGLKAIESDAYVCFLFNEGTNLVVRCILKTAIATASSGAPITTIDKTITIAKGGTAGNWGYLAAANNQFRRDSFSIGDDLYVTISGTAIADGNPAIALKIDIVAQTWEVFMTASNDDTPTTMTYNAVTDNVLATRGSTAELFENISLASLPLTY